jgi:hypothetical protein
MEKMMNLTTMTRQEVLDFMEEHKISVGISYEHDGDEFWGFSGQGGFHTFDAPSDEDRAMYASVLFHILHYDYNMEFGDAERLAMSYVEIYKVMQEPMSEEENEEISQQLLETIESGNFEIAIPETSEEEQETEEEIKEENDNE